MNTAPKPLTVAGALPSVPGMEKDASVMSLPTGVNNRDGLKVVKMLAYVGLPKSTANPPLVRPTEEPAKAPFRVW